tara:strand:+ start:128 stop:910 length:783 start_codon:yes stop_codon:yes gene_type:complete
MIFLRKFFLFLPVAFFLFTAIPGMANAQTKTPDINTPEYWRQQNIVELEKWRENIPDYEKRLYDRVKKINKRSVRLTNLIIASFVLTIIIFVIGFSFIILRLKRIEVMASLAVSYEVPSPSGIERPNNEDKTKNQPTLRTFKTNQAMLNDLKEDQKALHSALSSLKLFFEEKRSHDEEISKLIEGAENWLAKLDTEADSASSPGAKGYINKQKKLQRAQEDLKIYLIENRDNTHGISRLIDSAERNINGIDEKIGSHEVT